MEYAVGGYNPISVMSYKFTDISRRYGFNFSKKDLESRHLSFVDSWEKTSSSITVQRDDEVEIKTKLSKGDIDSLRCLHLYRDEEFDEKCSS